MLTLTLFGTKRHIRRIVETQALTKALIQFSEQSGLVFVIPADLVKQKKSAAVRGYMTPSDALTRLLAGSGLVGGIDDKGIVSIKPEENVNEREWRFDDETETPKEITAFLRGNSFFDIAHRLNVSR